MATTMWYKQSYFTSRLLNPHLFLPLCLYTLRSPVEVLSRKSPFRQPGKLPCLKVGSVKGRTLPVIPILIFSNTVRWLVD
jgi:hypothetical protein